MWLHSQSIGFAVARKKQFSAEDIELLIDEIGAQVRNNYLCDNNENRHTQRQGESKMFFRHADNSSICTNLKGKAYFFLIIKTHQSN